MTCPNCGTNLDDVPPEEHCPTCGSPGRDATIYLDPNDMCFYPRSGKVLLRGLGVIFRPERVGFWDED